MARKTTPLTDTQIRSAKPKEKEYSLADGDGLSLRIKPNGTKSWIFNYYQPYSKKRMNISFGPYPENSLAKAREQRKLAREKLAQHIDPKEDRAAVLEFEQAKHQNSLEFITEQWLELKRHSVTESHYLKTKRNLERHLLKPLGKVPIHLLTPKHITQNLTPLQNQGKLETVKRTCQQLNEVMTFALNTGLIEQNPLQNITKTFKPPKRQNLPTLNPADLPAFMRTLQFAQIKIVTRLLIEWQLHTMVRPSEAVGAKWDEIDLIAKVWRVPPERMKKKREHIVPLTEQVIALLNNLKKLNGNTEYLFPSTRKPREPMNSQTANMAIKRMGYKGKLVAHGLRSLASTTLNESGLFVPDVIEAALAHVDKNQVRAAYNRAQYLNARREMMEWWSKYIESASQGNLRLVQTTNS